MCKRGQSVMKFNRSQTAEFRRHVKNVKIKRNCFSVSRQQTLHSPVIFREAGGKGDASA